MRNATSARVMMLLATLLACVVLYGGARSSGHALSAAEGEAPSSTFAASLSPSDVGAALVAARARLSENGLSAQELRPLETISIELADLPGATLGGARGSVIALDATAAGWGWFVDPTPLDDAEFSNAGAIGGAADRIDLLTTLAHEMLHVLGRSDLSAALYPRDVMAGTLPRGVRRLQSSNVSNALEPVAPPVPTFTLPPGRSVTITVDATIALPLPPGVAQVSVQASIAGDTLGTILSDDPATGAAGDPTTLPVIRLAGTVDADADGRTDLAIFRVSTGEWFITNSATNYTTSTVQQFGLPGDVPVAGDYDGDGQLDLAVYRPSTATWFIRPSSTATAVSYQWGLSGDLPVPGDYNGDGKIDLAVYRPATGFWYILTSSSTYTASVTTPWGLSGDIPVPGDYDGDGKTDLAVYRPMIGTWYILTSTSGSTISRVLPWGLNGDVPVPGEYDGDGITDVAVYRPGTADWFILQSTTDFATSTSFHFGLAGDVAVPSDYDGDGQTDLAVYRRATGMWYVALSTSAYTTSMAVQWGLSGDLPAPNAAIAHALALRSTLATLVRASDVDGDRRSDLTVYRPSTGAWHTKRSSSEFATSASFPGGLSGARPVPHDYDGDGQSDLALFRPSTLQVPVGAWSIVRSSSHSTTATEIPWTHGGDLPVPGDYDGDAVSDLATYHRTTGVWTIRKSGSATTVSFQWGLSNDVPVPGDYDGDALTDLAVYRPSTGDWFIRSSSTGFAATASYQWGLPGDVSVPGEYDGDGKTDLAVYRPSTGQWFIRHSSTGYATSASYQWGLSADAPVPGDFDGDRKTDLAVWRPSTGEWLLLHSSSGFTVFDQVQWGMPGDVPILRRP